MSRATCWCLIWRPRFGETVAEAGILISDGVHPNDAGVLHWVAAFTRFIAPR
ncbi:hypothetical protein QFZ57_001934 [Arthrobacter sp. B1I2]|nr:hypothetical protein [Arthrobacter sp. B1I2]